MTTTMLYVEHLVGSELVEFEYELEFEYEPYVPAQTSGPPEDCYPADGGYAGDFEVPLRRRAMDPKGSPWETVPFSIFLEGVVAQKRYQDDPADKKYRKTAMDKAMEYLKDTLAEVGEDDYRDRREAALEARYDYDKEND